MAAMLPLEVLSHLLSLVVPLNLKNAEFYDSDWECDHDEVDMSRYPMYAACARVCKSWHTAALPFLYQRIEMESIKRTEIFSQSIALRPSLAGYVHHFSALRTHNAEGAYEISAERTHGTIFPRHLAKLLMKLLSTTKRLHLPGPFIPYLNLLSSKAGRDRLEVSGAGLSETAYTIYPLSSSVLTALPSELTDLILSNFKINKFEPVDDLELRPTIFPRVKTLRLQYMPLTPGLAGQIARAPHLRHLTSLI